MITTVLVTYATRYGSTAEVAETIATTLHARGLEVDVRPAREVRTLIGYGAVVLGAPLYMGNWHSAALQFLSRLRDALGERPVAIFALGPLHADEAESQASRAQLDKTLAGYPWLRPIAQAIFGGKFRPATLGFSDRLVTRLLASPLKGQPACDARDWSAIRTWATDLATLLKPVVSQARELAWVK